MGTECRRRRTSGLKPLPTLSGSSLPVGEALGLVAASFAVYLMPILAVASIGLLLSVVTRNSAAAVAGTLLISLMLQLVAILPRLDPLAPYLLPSQFSAWTGLLRDPVDWAPIVCGVGLGRACRADARGGRPRLQPPRRGGRLSENWRHRSVRSGRRRARAHPCDAAGVRPHVWRRRPGRTSLRRRCARRLR